ncbi:MAG: type II secretion system F family protein [Phycisphaerales bacterium]|nr:type II secretion system F family protein [Phycisphaerales bacterium]
MLNQIADFRARESELLGKVKAAMVYPAVLACLAVIVVVGLLTFFIPRFATMFADFGASLPWLTQAILAASTMLTKYGWMVLAVVIGVGWWARRWLRTEKGRRGLEKVLLALPGLGTIVARFALVRFARMLGTLLAAGVPMVTALRVAQEAIGNQTLADAVGQASDQVKQGSALSRSLGACAQLFPPSVVEMVAVAEETGRLDKELLRLAQTYEVELDRRLRMLVSLAEPVLLFLMASLIGTIVIGMLLPIFTLQELIQ